MIIQTGWFLYGTSFIYKYYKIGPCRRRGRIKGRRNIKGKDFILKSRQKLNHHTMML